MKRELSDVEKKMTKKNRARVFSTDCDVCGEGKITEGQEFDTEQVNGRAVYRHADENDCAG